MQTVALPVKRYNHIVPYAKCYSPELIVIQMAFAIMNLSMDYLK